MSSTTTWMHAAKPHPNGDTKPCSNCGHTITRTTRVATRDWNTRNYCSKSCAATGAARTRATNNDTTTALGEQVRQQAACNGHWADFVPDSKTDAGDAIAVCRTRCPVRAQCLAYGLATKSTGVWGGEWLDPWKPGRQTIPDPRGVAQ